ncbi:MAG: hypothetical protein GY756_20245, partial [bacterium]|nr:hypothetical protein [bacterium]
MSLESQEIQLSEETVNIHTYVTDKLYSNKYLKLVMQKILESDLSNDTFSVKKEKDVINKKLEILYKKATELYSIKTEYKYIIFNENNKVLLGNSDKNYVTKDMNVHDHCLGSLIHEQYKIKHDDFSAGIYFPNERIYLLSKVKSLLVALILFVIILIISFVYITYTIFKQKKLSDIKNDFIN